MFNKRAFIPLIILTFLLTISSKAQLTADFPDSNYYWNESHWTRGCDMTCPFHYIVGTMFDSTSHIKNGLTYRSIYFKGSQYTMTYDIPPQVINITNYTSLQGYIRNDKLNKKVYFRNSILDTTSDQLLYDFNLKLGDAYPITKQHSQFSDSAYIFRVDTLTDPYGITRTVNYVSGFGGANLYGSGAIVEGIGTLTGILSNTIYGNYGWSESNELNCFTTDTLNYSMNNPLPEAFSFSSTNSCTTHQYLSVDSKKEIEIKIFPNPVTSTFTINTPDEEATFTLINTLGQSQEIKGVRDGGIWKFDVSSLTSGIFYLKVNSAGNLYLSKIIK